VYDLDARTEVVECVRQGIMKRQTVRIGRVLSYVKSSRLGCETVFIHERKNEVMCIQNCFSQDSFIASVMEY